MDSEQQSLFGEWSNPLEERIGKAFFDDLPKTPGVYVMYGNAGQVLYVGKAKNLRNRLFTYRRAKESNSSRKVCRLVRMITDIEIFHCPSEEAALLKENELIRKYRPEFNRAKKRPENYYFITLQVTDSQINFRLAMEKPEDPDLLNHTYGSFKGHRAIRKGTGALLRQLYLLERQITTVFEFPTVLTNNLTPLSYKMDINNSLVNKVSLNDFLLGRSLEFIEQLVVEILTRRLLEKYIGRFILKDCEILKRFYDHCLNRNYQIKQALELEDRLIPQTKLDDYLIKATFRS